MTQKDLFVQINKAHASQRPFVLFRVPQEIEIKSYIVRDQVDLNPKSSNFSGFILAPFNAVEEHIGFSQDACDIAIVKQSLVPFTEGHRTRRELASSKSNHIALVKKGVQFLKKTTSKKVVLSRQIRQRVANFDYLNAFSKLLNYKNAFVYCWYHPDKGMWIGATPETLLNVEGTEFSTMSLAGTKPNLSDKEMKWGKKEIYEQKVVTDYIESQLKGISFTISTPYTMAAGNVAHIRTDVNGTLNTKTTLNELIDRLHPTPAVCGIPMEETKQFILEEERYKRSFYTGYLGEVRVNDKTNLFVNLRCMHIKHSTASIFVGGGITLASEPEAEWQETCEKAKLMLGLL